MIPLLGMILATLVASVFASVAQDFWNTDRPVAMLFIACATICTIGSLAFIAEGFRRVKRRMDLL